MRVFCSWCKKQTGVKEPLEDTSATHTICEDCMEKFKDQLHEQHPEVADEEEQPAMIFKCGCTYGRGRYLKLCWRHGG